MARGLIGRALGALFRSGDSPENPANSVYARLGLSPEDWGTATPLQFGPIYRAVTLIGGDVGKLPLVVYRRNGPQDREKYPEHPAYVLLRRQANPLMTADVWRESQQANVLLHGNSYSVIERDSLGRPVALWPQDPTTVTVMAKGRDVRYVVQPREGGKPETYFADEVLHVRGLGSGLVGMSVIQAANPAWSQWHNAQKFGAAYFKNGALPGFVIEHPKVLTMDDAKRLLDMWNASGQGVGNAHRTRIIHSGQKFHQLTINAEDAQLIETQKFALTDIANWFGLPPHSLGGEGQSGYNSIEAENAAYLDRTLDRWLVRWESECYAKLMTEDEKRTDAAYPEFVRQALARGDMKTRSQYYRMSLAGAPWETVNEVRAMENLNRVDDERCDAIQYPANNFGNGEGAGTTGGEAEGERSAEPPAADEPDPMLAARVAVLEALENARGRVRSRLQMHLARAKSPEARQSFWANFEAKHGLQCRDMLRPEITAARALGSPVELETTLADICGGLQG